LRRLARAAPPDERRPDGGGSSKERFRVTFLYVLLGLVILLLFVPWLLRLRVTVHQFERGVLFTRGRFVRALPPGAYWVLRPFHSIRVIDMRSSLVSIGGQEILSADHVAVKATLALRIRVVAPDVAVLAAKSFEEVLYLEAQLILRDSVSALPVDDLLQKRSELADQIRARLEPRAAELGLALETVGVKDITFPGALKQMFAQVVAARKDAQAAIERARGETASLRHLANAARLLEGNPALVTLKTLQTAGSGKNTLVLGLSQPVLPLARDEAVEADRSPKSLKVRTVEESPPAEE
jgi:regulator of protease activity HflC (stomatin/prohibitin superfamily)